MLNNSENYFKGKDKQLMKSSYKFKSRQFFVIFTSKSCFEIFRQNKKKFKILKFLYYKN